MSPSILFALLLTVDSLHFVFAKLLFPHGNPETMGMLVLLVGTIEVGLFGIITKQLDFSIFKRNAPFFLAIGLCISTSLVINYHAIKYIDPGTGSLISQTGTLWGIVFGILWLKEKLSPRQFLGVLIAISGVLVVKIKSPDFVQIGTWMVLGSTFIYSLHTALSKRFGDEIDFISFFFFRLLSTLVVLILFNLGLDNFSFPSPTGWKLILLVGTVDVVISRTLFYLTLRKLKLSIHTIALTISPLVAILWSLILFNSIPTPKELLGGAIILIGILIINLTPKRKLINKSQTN